MPIADSGGPYIWGEVKTNAIDQALQGFAQFMMNAGWVLTARIQGSISTTIDISSMPNYSPGNQIQTAGILYTFVSVLDNTVPRQILIGATMVETLTNLQSAMNGLWKLAGIKFSRRTRPNPIVRFSFVGPNANIITATFTAKQTGAAGNSIDTSFGPTTGGGYKLQGKSNQVQFWLRPDPYTVTAFLYATEAFDNEGRKFARFELISDRYPTVTTNQHTLLIGDQLDPQAHVNDLAIDATDSTKVTSGSRPFSQADVGKWLQIVKPSDPTYWTVGKTLYQILIVGDKVSDFTVDFVHDTWITSQSRPFLASDVGTTVVITGGFNWIPGSYEVLSVMNGVAVFNIAPTLAGNVQFGIGYVEATGGAAYLSASPGSLAANTGSADIGVLTPYTYRIVASPTQFTIYRQGWTADTDGSFVMGGIPYMPVGGDDCSGQTPGVPLMDIFWLVGDAGNVAAATPRTVIGGSNQVSEADAGYDAMTGSYGGLYSQTESLNDISGGWFSADWVVNERLLSGNNFQMVSMLPSDSFRDTISSDSPNALVASMLWVGDVDFFLEPLIAFPTIFDDFPAIHLGQEYVPRVYAQLWDGWIGQKQVDADTTMVMDGANWVAITDQAKFGTLWLRVTALTPTVFSSLTGNYAHTT